MRRALLFLILLAPAAGAQSVTIEAFTKAVRDARTGGKSDSSLAALALNARPSEHLTDAVIEQLETEGAGPDLLDALERQRDATFNLNAPPSLEFLAPFPSAPTPEQQLALIRTTRRNALQYTAGLPDFLCTQEVERYSSVSGQGAWKLDDVLELSVGYSAKGEQYKLQTINDRPTKKTLNKVGGFSSSGEFGSALQMVFRAEAFAAIHWERWTNLKGRRAQVLSYAIDARHSGYFIGWSRVMNHHTIAGMRGLVFVDVETGQVLRLTTEAAELPPDCPLLRAYGVLDYGYFPIGSQEFLLPRRVESNAILRGSRQRNVSEFSAYRKFSGDATIKFESAEDPPSAR